MNDPIAILAGRLNAGWIMCETEPDDAKRARLEDHWIALLHDYERLVDGTRHIAKEISNDEHHDAPRAA